MKTWWLLGVFLGLSLMANAQNNFLFSHYMFNPTYFNPAWIGSESSGFVAFQHRSQWIGYNTTFDGAGGAPNTQLLTGVAPIRDFFISGIGLTVSSDNLGPVSNFQLQIPVSYSLDLRSGILNVGVAPTVFSQTLRFDELRFNDPTDPLNTGRRETQIQPDLAAGLFYRADNSLFFGVSAVNILQPGFDFGLDSLVNAQKISYAAHGGYTFQVNDNLNISPSLLFRSDLKGFTFDVGAIATLNGRMWTGISYRREESAIIYLGYSLLQENKLKVGYAFDYILEGQNAKAATSHEIFIRYDLPDLVFGGKKAVKTPRFSF